ncbi:hypothetical protein IGI04_027090 [Brassica rapa subsp. trilocularis]|uniref:LOB domain-containing protein n=1 Tax=Brassica rapa subsp. trilocularis TaxID=1813537 RepID=A0ABQ7KY63_BRACM|nr:hypothetical protein IGI04_027090 [Brassica rapa subsp. trilocularis]
MLVSLQDIHVESPFSGRRVALSRVFIVASALALRFRYLLQRNGSTSTMCLRCDPCVTEAVEWGRRIRELGTRLSEEAERLQAASVEFSNLQRVRQASVALNVWQPEVVCGRQKQMVEQSAVPVSALEMESPSWRLCYANSKSRPGALVPQSKFIYSVFGRQSCLRKRQHRRRNVKRGGELTCSSTKSNICCKRFQAPLMHATVDVHRLNTFVHLFKTGSITGEPDTSSQELFQFRDSEQLLGCENTNTSSRGAVDDSSQGKESVLNGGPGDVVPGVSTFPAMINVMVMTINEKEPAIETT